MLTQKQETFTQNLFKGLSQREAYIQAGYSSGSSVTTIDRNAHELAKNSKIITRYDELNQPARNAAIATVEERQERLSVFVREDINGQHGVTRHSNIQAIAELNKMGGDYAPEKHRIELDLPVNIIYKLKEIKAIEAGEE